MRIFLNVFMCIRVFVCEWGHQIFNFKFHTARLVYCRKLRIWSHLLKKSVMKNFIFCVVLQVFSGTVVKVCVEYICNVSGLNVD